jgi:hypothetical protein
MAKGIRSKSKRKNRTVLRQTVYEPLIRANQDKIAKKIADDLKQIEGSSITKLRKVIKAPAGNATAAPGVKDKELNSSRSSEDNVPTAGLNSAIKKGARLLPTLKKRGSRPNANPGKQMEWFR